MRKVSSSHFQFSHSPGEVLQSHQSGPGQVDRQRIVSLDLRQSSSSSSILPISRQWLTFLWSLILWSVSVTLWTKMIKMGKNIIKRMNLLTVVSAPFLGAITSVLVSLNERSVCGWHPWRENSISWDGCLFIVTGILTFSAHLYCVFENQLLSRRMPTIVWK